MIDINEYLNKIRKLAASGHATEHSYRPALDGLFRSIDKNVTVINEPKQIAVGAPDFVFARNGVSIGWCEAKDLLKNIKKFKAGDYSKEQKERYKKGLPNLIYTNGTDFEFIVKGEVTGFVSIAELVPTLPARPEEFPRLEMLLRDFASQTPISINTAKQLAEMMAGKAIIIKDIMGNALVADTEAGVSTELTDQYEGFKNSLIHDITIADFADIYAETIAYGLFAARLHDASLGSFSRAEALELLPKSNPFLRNLFVYIAGPNLDERLRRMIDDLCDVFRACDVGALMQDFGKFTARNDPFLHFYETFLAEYNPTKRKARGVWYTPEPVVNFIVRAVDDVLKSEFDLPLGLADTTKVSIDWDSGQNDAKGKPVMVKKDVHRVQILDPATGTGTFLAEAVKQIATQVKGVAEGMWSSYVERDLIPRLHGFELLMASYAMCHLKLDMMLTELGYEPSSSPPRLGVYLTNSLEEGERVEQTLPFARWLSEEAKGANTIKRDTPIMCVIGNPPYSGISQNMGSWIADQIEAYKFVDGVHFGEKKHSLHDDYVKFVRLAELMIEKNGEGVLAFITNHGYLDNPTFRGMRWHLLKTFDKISVIDLHGNTKRGENPPAGVSDKNVFDIQQGVAIIIAVKKKSASKDNMATVAYGDLWGTRDEKYEALFTSAFADLASKHIEPETPHFSLNGKKSSNSDYGDGFLIVDLMSVHTTGVQTSRDPVSVSHDRENLTNILSEITDHRIETAIVREKYFTQTSKKYPKGDTRDWKLAAQRAKIALCDIPGAIRPYAFRPLDNRLIAFIPELISWPRMDVSKHMLRDNISLITARSNKTGVNHFLCSRFISDVKCGEATTGSIFAPLYLYPDEGSLEQERRVNFDKTIYENICTYAELTGESGDELKVFDYIYGVLHSPDYRRDYAQFLKIDFARIPYPASAEVFAHIADKGAQLRNLHLMEDVKIRPTSYQFKGSGDNSVGKLKYSSDGRVMINPNQYFENVPQNAWEFYIGGYQPAQKWLKDRKGRILSFDDVMHYQKIIHILVETDRIMNEIKLPLGG